MNVDKLLKLISEKEKALYKSLKEENTELEFIEKVTTENCFSNVSSLLSINKHDVLTAYLCATSKKLSYEQIKKLTPDITNIDNYEICISLLSKIKDDYEMLDFDNDIKKTMMRIILGKDKTSQIKSIKTLYGNNGKYLSAIFTIMSVLEEMEVDYQIHKETIEFMEIQASDKKKNSVAQSQLQVDYNIKNIMKELSKISSYYQSLTSEEKNRKKTIKTKLNNYSELKLMLNNIKTKGISSINLDKVIELTIDEDVKKEFLCQLNNVQKKEFDNLYKEYCKLSVDNQLEIQRLFEKYNYDFNSLPLSIKNKVMELNRDTIDAFLLNIKQLNIDNNNVSFILENSNYNILNNVISMIKDGILNTKFVTNNLNILSINEQGKYYNLIDLLEYMKNENINPRLFINDQNIYVSDSNTIKNNLKILKQYNLLSSLKTTEIFNMLKENDLASKIDMLLELGYEKELENNLGLLNSNNKKIKSLYLLKDMNLLPTDMDSLIMVLNNESFIQGNDINKYIFNVVDYRIDKSKINYTETNIYEETNSLSRTIVINDVKLSRNRVMRNKKMLENSNLQDTEKEIYSYIYGSILNEDEYNKVVSYVNGNVKVK